MNRKRDKREQHDWVSATDGDARLVTFHEDIPPNLAKRVLAIQKDIQTGKIQGALFAGEDFTIESGLSMSRAEEQGTDARG